MDDPFCDKLTNAINNPSVTVLDREVRKYIDIGSIDPKNKTHQVIMGLNVD